MKRYRIVTDCGGGYGCQKRIYLFFWRAINNTFGTIEEAESYLLAIKKEAENCKKRRGKVIKYV